MQMSYFFYTISTLLVFLLVWRLFFSIRSIKNFPQAVLPTILAMKEYMQALRMCVQTQDFTLEQIKTKKTGLEKALTERSSKYPEWIYQSGFNPGLRAGARSFLIKLEHVIELLFALEFILLGRNDSFNEYSDKPSFPIIDVMDKNEALLLVIENYFLAKQQVELHSNLTSDINQLEEGLKELVPNSLELLDMSPKYLQLTGLVRNLKDTRQVLLSLISALPA